MATTSLYPTSQIAMYNGLHSFYSLDSDVINGVLNLSYSDPTYLAFRVFFDLESAGGLFGLEAHQNTALTYLKNIGDENRYNALKKLIQLLSAIQTSARHCFASIDGLQDAWNQNINDILIKDKKISLKLTESVDWRMTTIASLIRYICYDFERKVYVLPQNLRSFNMVVYVTELRIFAEQQNYGSLDRTIQSFLGISESSFGDTHTEVFNNQEFLKKLNEEQAKQGYKKPFTQRLNDKLWGVKTTDETGKTNFTQKNPNEIDVYCTQGVYVMFGLGDCEFETNTGADFFSSIDMTADPNMRDSNMVISYGSLHVSEHLPVGGSLGDKLVPQYAVYEKPKLNKALKSDAPEPGLAKTSGTLQDIRKGTVMSNLIRNVVSKIKDQALDYAQDFAQATTLNLMTEAAMQASRKLVGKVVGNTYNFNAIDFLTISNPQMAFMKVKQGVKQATTDNPATIVNNSNKKAMSESPVYKESGNKKQSLPVKNIYDNRNSL